MWFLTDFLWWSQSRLSWSLTWPSQSPQGCVSVAGETGMVWVGSWPSTNKALLWFPVTMPGAEEEEATWAANSFWIHPALGRRGHKNDGKCHLHVPGYGAVWGKWGECGVLSAGWRLCVWIPACSWVAPLLPGRKLMTNNTDKLFYLEKSCAMGLCTSLEWVRPPP